MKIVLSILSILTVLTVYSTGAFVPETQGMTDTVAGLTVLIDAEMAQQMGGVLFNETQKVKKAGSGSIVTLCRETWDLRCVPFRRTQHKTKYKCVQCYSHLTHLGAYRNDNVIVRVDSGCNRRYGNCEPWRQDHYEVHCAQFLKDNCNY